MLFFSENNKIFVDYLEYVTLHEMILNPKSFFQKTIRIFYLFGISYKVTFWKKKRTSKKISLAVKDGCVI